jgi:hypothetical protein
MSTEDCPNEAALRDRDRIRQIPGVRVVGFVVTAGLATLSMFSMAGAVVMFLFWQEIRGGRLLATENERTGDILALLQDLERSVPFVVLVVASVWTFAAVSNIRMASARRRNPILLTSAIGVLVFVHVQGLAGLSTLSETSESAQVARLVGYFAIVALLPSVPSGPPLERRSRNELRRRIHQRRSLY